MCGRVCGGGVDRETLVTAADLQLQESLVRPCPGRGYACSVAGGVAAILVPELHPNVPQQTRT